LPAAYVLVLCDYSFPDYEIVSQLSKLPCVTEVNRVDGPYDIIVKLSDDNADMIKESIGKYMTRICGMQSTLTLMAEPINLLDWQKHNSPTLFLGLNEKI
jgi:DNA-binding Lrp family transcriptional regulator